VVVLSGGTDGTDGPTDAAGAIADGATLERAGRLGLNARQFLAENDSYRFFDALGDLLKTGPTGTNVMDLRLVLVGRPRVAPAVLPPVYSAHSTRASLPHWTPNRP
jgi:hydroxypyruvate reductase